MPKYTLLTSFQDENNKLHEVGDSVSLSKEKAAPLIANGTLAPLESVEEDDVVEVTLAPLDADEDTETALET